MRRRWRQLWLAWLFAIGGGAGLVLLSVLFGGMSLGALLLPVALLPALVPQIAGRQRALWIGGLQSLLIAVGAGAAWLLVLDGRSLPLSSRVWAALVMAGWSLLLWSATAALIYRPARRRGVLRAAGVTIVAWLWLAFPVWLGPTLSQRAMDVPVWVTSLHPLFAMNAAVRELGIWTQQPLAYQLTPLGQDVRYALPGSVAWFVIAHLICVIALASFASVARRVSRRRDGPRPRGPSE